MGVCNTVVLLTEALEKAKQPTLPRHRLLAQILKLMPLYNEIHDLAAWEAAYQGAMEEADDNSEIGLLLWEIFEFGRYNLYSAFDVEGTSECYDQLSSMFSENGIVNPIIQPELDRW